MTHNDYPLHDEALNLARASFLTFAEDVLTYGGPRPEPTDHTMWGLPEGSKITREARVAVEHYALIAVQEIEVPTDAEIGTPARRIVAVRDYGGDYEFNTITGETSRLTYVGSREPGADKRGYIRSSVQEPTELQEGENALRRAIDESNNRLIRPHTSGIGGFVMKLLGRDRRGVRVRYPK